MIHVTCDLCGKDLRPGEEQRYVVKIEVYAAHDADALNEADLDDDHLQAVSELLSDEDHELTDADNSESSNSHRRFDLCPACRNKYLKDPLSREVDLHFNFSEN